MKKSLTILTWLVLSVFIASCQKEETSSVVVSKLFDASSQSNNVIELYNNSDLDEDLSNYTIQIYTNGVEEPSKFIELSGTIAANSYYSIIGSTATDNQVLAAADYTYQEGSLPFNGNDAIELVKKSTTIDYLGYTGIDISFALDVTLIRLGEKEDYAPSSLYYDFNFITYIPDAFMYLENDTHEIKTLDDLYAGPLLEERYLSMPYVSTTNQTIGGGGAVTTFNTGIADGDTAYFTASNGFAGGSVRYFYLNTPEVNGGVVVAEPWGYVASKYNKKYLLVDANTKDIKVQSIPGYSLEEGYGRNLALVWVNGALSQFLIVSEGLTEDVGSAYHDYDVLLTYKNVPYLTFMRFAEERARINGWGVHGYPSNPDGEKSPDWNYQADANSTNDPIWEPHLDLPWA